MTNEIYIEENIKFKILGFLINLILIFGLVFVPEPESIQIPAWYTKMDLYLTILLSIPLVWQIRALFRKTGLKLHALGLEENMTHIKSQNFLWSEIVSIRFMKVSFLKYILIYIKDPASHFKKQNFYKRFGMKWNLKKYGTPIKIPIHAINKTPQEILDVIVGYTKSLTDKKLETP